MKNKRKQRSKAIDELVCQNLKKRRQFLGLPQAAIATHLGISIQQVQKYETGTNRISSGKLYYIAKLLKIPIDSFFKS